MSANVPGRLEQNRFDELVLDDSHVHWLSLDDGQVMRMPKL